MFHRLLIPPKRSFLLLGPRGSGKSTWLKKHFAGKQSHFIDMLDLATQRRLLTKPHVLADELRALSKSVKWVVIDEVQKQPKLLDLVHQFIEGSQLKFALTGSSARKLKRGAANLLAGRANFIQMYPLLSYEMGKAFQLNDILNWGALPAIQNQDEKEQRREILNSYASLYLKEEIQQEQIVRKIEPFSLFLEVAAQTDGRVLNFSKVAKDVGVDTKTVMSYFKILEDTFMGFFLFAYHKSIRKRQKSSPKFYFFDPGVRKTLEGNLDIEFKPRTSEWGRTFEGFIINEALRINAYLRRLYRFSFLNVPPQGEIDLVIEKSSRETVLVEIKSTDAVGSEETVNLKRFREHFAGPHCYVLSLDKTPKKIDGIHCLHWQQGLKEIFDF